jgi:uncharacterized protein (TIGR02001 family)
VKRHILSLLTIAVIAAQEIRADSATVLSGSIGGTSDFVYRGLSLTRGKPAAQASLDLEFPGEFYLGGFVATCDPNRGPSPAVEMDFWAGKYWRVAKDFSADVRLAQYLYPDDPRRRDYDRTELSATLGFRNRLFFAAVYSPNTDAVASTPGYAQGDAWAFELSGRQPLGRRLSLGAGFGRYVLEKVYGGSYNYWNLTLSADLRPFDVQLAYLGISGEAESHFARDAVGERVALTALWRFSTAP